MNNQLNPLMAEQFDYDMPITTDNIQKLRDKVVPQRFRNVKSTYSGYTFYITFKPVQPDFVFQKKAEPLEVEISHGVKSELFKLASFFIGYELKESDFCACGNYRDVENRSREEDLEVCRECYLD